MFSAAALLSISPLVAQDLVSAGTITSFSKENGKLALVPESRTGNPLLFSNMSTVPVFYASGESAPLDALHAGQTATIHYQQLGKRVVIAKITVPDPRAIRCP